MARETWDINEYRVLSRALSLNLLSKMMSQWGSLLNGVNVNVRWKRSLSHDAP